MFYLKKIVQGFEGQNGSQGGRGRMGNEEGR